MLEFLKFNIGGFRGYTTVEVILENSLVKVSIDSMLHPDSNGEKILSASESTAWLDKLEELQIYKWKSRYEGDLHICDGQDWSLEYKRAGKRCRHISGNNVYPLNWRRFLFLMNEISPLDMEPSLERFDFIYENEKSSIVRDGEVSLVVTKKYLEKIVIDRQQKTLNFLRHFDSGCEIRNECYTEHGIHLLLNEIEELFSNAEYIEHTDVGNPSFRLTLHYEYGDDKIISGSYNRVHLPVFWEEVIFEIDEFISLYDFLGECCNPNVFLKGVKEEEFIYCSVQFKSSEKTFYYRTEDDTLQVGDVVMVPVGDDNYHRSAKIQKIEYYEESEVPYSVGLTKQIVCKRQHNETGIHIFNTMNYNNVKLYFAELPSAREIPMIKFFEELWELNCMLPYYYKYLKNEELDVGAEMKFIDTADFTYAFAILTLVFREDHFCNGSICGRIEDGTLDKVIARINMLFENE